MRIPKRFSVLGHQVTVKFDPESLDQLGACGSWSLGNAVIRLVPEDSAHNRRMVEHAFCHEWVHCMLEMIGEKKLSENEKFVDLLAGVLHQSLSSMQGELE